MKDPAARARAAVARLFHASPVHALTLKGRTPGEPVPGIAQSWPGDPGAGADIMAGGFVFAGEAEAAGPGLWPRARLDDGWAAALHGFDWLDDLRAEGSDAARLLACELIAGWLAEYRRWEEAAWRPDALARRIAAWLAHYDFYASEAGPELRAALRRSLAEQARHLARVAPGPEDGLTRLRVAKALTLAALSFPRGGPRLGPATRLVEAEADRQVLADGGHASRNPAALLAALELLIDMRAAFMAAAEPPPHALLSAIDRAAPALRFLRHGDGRLAVFNGGGEESARDIESVLGRAEAPGRGPEGLPHSGYQRLAAGDTAVFADTGPPPPPGLDRYAHAGTLGFEMSVGEERLIVSCGAHGGDAAHWRPAQRATAAHSTLVVAETNSADWAPDGRLVRRPRDVTWRRDESEDGTVLELGHDGYVEPFGLVHRRRLYLARDGSDLRGEDSLLGPGEHAVAVRFHLHPEVRASLVQTGDGALLRLPGGSGWRFQASGGEPRLEESVYLGRDGRPRRTEQIVLSATVTRGGPAIKWAIRRIADRG